MAKSTSQTQPPSLAIGSLRERARSSRADVGSSATADSVPPDLGLSGERPTSTARAPTAGHERESSAKPGTVLDVAQVARDVRILRVARPPGFAYRPGQNVKVGLASVGKSNPYTIASAPHEPHLEFCIERVSQGRVTPGLFVLSAGERVLLGARAKGSFALDARASVHWMFATVTGIAPFRSMVLDASQRHTRGRFVIVHGASYADELAYRDLFEELASRAPEQIQYHPTVSRPTEARNRAWTGATGRAEVVGLPKLQAERGAAGSIRVYACGNSGMIANVRAEAQALGLPFSSEAFD